MFMTFILNFVDYKHIVGLCFVEPSLHPGINFIDNCFNVLFEFDSLIIS